jgi:hypothetical protein
MAKKDFSGKNKTKDTYDKDWVLTKVRQKGGTFVQAWVPKAEAKRMRNNEKEAKAYNQQINTPPAPPAAPPTAPILTTPPSAPGTTPEPPPPATTPPGVPNNPGEPNPPSWWINSAIQNPTTEEQKFANMANAILPTLSPEDQRTLGMYLAQNFKNVYGGYANTNFSSAPTEMTGEWRKSFLNPQRAKLALTLLEKMKAASGGADMGAGYDYLKNAVNLMNQFTTDGVMTREKYQQFQNAVAAMQKNAGGNLGAYANLAQLFNLPSFSAGPLVSNEPNKKLFS